jgi:hypothetical protein
MTPEQFNEHWKTGTAFTTTRVDVYEVTIASKSGRGRLGLVAHPKLVEVLQASDSFLVEAAEYARLELDGDHIYQDHKRRLHETLDFLDVTLTVFLDSSTTEDLTTFVAALFPERRQQAPRAERPESQGEPPRVLDPRRELPGIAS